MLSYNIVTIAYISSNIQTFFIFKCVKRRSIFLSHFQTLLKTNFIFSRFVKRIKLNNKHVNLIPDENEIVFQGDFEKDIWLTFNTV